MNEGWKVAVVTKLNGAVYKYHVDGWNRYTGEAFSWDVPSIERGYDLSEAYFRNATGVIMGRGTDCYGTAGN
jgi:hypothetical protein